MSTPPSGKLGLPELAAMKRRGEKIVMVTAYDSPGARFAEDAGIDILLVGDTAAMVVLGHESTTVPVTVDEMLFLTRTVARAANRPIVVGDMPFGSYQVSDEDAVSNAIRFVKEGGADVVKLEGAGTSIARARAIVAAGIPVMGHIGLTPQSATMLGGFKTQGKTAERALALVARRSNYSAPAASRSCSRRCPPRWRAGSPSSSRSRPSASAPAPAATARCSSITTCSA
jgi:3-methyl-2-oxobutanoate hydroxymethyltransferase